MIYIQKDQNGPVQVSFSNRVQLPTQGQIIQQPTVDNSLSQNPTPNAVIPPNNTGN
jgi:hypothetical protein